MEEQASGKGQLSFEQMRTPNEMKSLNVNLSQGCI